MSQVKDKEPKSTKIDVKRFTQNSDIDRRLWAKRAGMAVAAAAGFALVMPEARDIAENRHGWLGLALLGSGVTLLSSRAETMFFGIRNRGKNVSRNAIVASGVMLSSLGGALLVHEGATAVSEWHQHKDSAHALGNLSDGQDPSVPPKASGKVCEIITDFKSISDADKASGRDVKDAKRLQWLLKSEGFYNGVIDGQLGKLSATGVDSLQQHLIDSKAEGVDISRPWNPVDCSYVPEFSDGNPSTPQFDDMPELRFDGFSG